MLVEQMTVAQGREHGIARWLLDRMVYELHELWTCCWWMFRAHVAACHGIPRDSLEAPQRAWMKVLQGPGGKDQ